MIVTRVTHVVIYVSKVLIVDFDLLFIVYIHGSKAFSIIDILFIELNISSVVYLADTWIEDSKLICDLVVDVYVLS